MADTPITVPSPVGLGPTGDGVSAQSFEPLQSLIDASPNIILGFDRDRRCILCNQTTRRMLDLHDPLSEYLWEHLPFSYQTETAICFYTTLQQQTPTELQTFIPRLERWLRIWIRPYNDGVVLFAVDVTDREADDEKLHEQQRETERQRGELETIYDTAPIGLALFDPVEFRYLRLNNRQAAFFRLEPSQILGKTLTEMAPIPGLREMFMQVAQGKPIVNTLLEGKLATDEPGTHRYWTVNYFPVYSSDGTIQAISAASLEITHQKKAELALIQSEKLAAVGRLASSISHEINNPLEAIVNLLFLISLDKDLPASVKNYVLMAQSELGRVSQIVTQTLRFHRQAVNPTSVTAAELVNAVLNLYQGRLTNSGIQVDTRYNTETRIVCFENDIRQVFNNLIANAIDAMRGGGHLLVRAHDAIHRDRATGECRKGVRITIADTGHGIPDKIRARIFEPFYTTKDLNGTGLGLWISEGIIAHHHGHLTFRSTQSSMYHGTIFSLFLPCERA